MNQRQVLSLQLSGLVEFSRLLSLPFPLSGNGPGLVRAGCQGVEIEGLKEVLLFEV